MKMEDEASRGHSEDFRSRIQPIRKELLTLRGYYDQYESITPFLRMLHEAAEVFQALALGEVVEHTEHLLTAPM